MRRTTIDIITAFPGMFTGFLNESMMARALARGLLSVNVHDLRDYTDDPHRTVDDTPFGGGGGMILKAEPIARAIESIRNAANGSSPSTVVIPTARGGQLNQMRADGLATHPHLILVCGHYTGIDERIFEHFNPIRVSIGDYVLTGGELPAMVVVDVVARRIPGFLGNDDSAKDDSHVIGGLGAAQYTRPQVWRGREVPQTLVSGHHANVDAWRRQNAAETTRAFRPDLLEEHDERAGDSSHARRTTIDRNKTAAKPQQIETEEKTNG
jgi:tRNA (guanine37-N1)-methyltransferase